MYIWRHDYKAQTPANKVQKFFNIVRPGNAFLAFLGTNVQIVKLRGKDRIQTFSGNVGCLVSMSVVYVLDTLALSISIFCTRIVSPVAAGKNTVLMKDSN